MPVNHRPVTTCENGRQTDERVTALTDEDPTMSGTSTPHLPRAGDIVIYEQHRPAGLCVVSSFQHASHLTFHTYDDAIRDAIALAVSHHVDAWYTADGQRYESVAAYREGQCSSG